MPALDPLPLTCSPLPSKARPHIPRSPEAAFTSPSPTVASPLNLGTCSRHQEEKGRGAGVRDPGVWSCRENPRQDLDRSGPPCGGVLPEELRRRPRDKRRVEGRSCKSKIKRPPARVLAGVQRAALGALLCYLSLHLPATSAGWVHRRRSINSH